MERPVNLLRWRLGFAKIVSWPYVLHLQDKDNVEYSVRAFPLGGYVAFPDDDENSDIDPEDPNLLRNRPILDRALVVSAGVIANVIFAYTVIFTQVCAD